MLYYYLGWFAFKQNEIEKAIQHFKYAAALNSDFCFPNRIEDVSVLQKAIELNADDAKAYYYLGNFWYDKRQYDDAIECWEKSVELNDKFAIVSLWLAYFILVFTFPILAEKLGTYGPFYFYAAICMIGFFICEIKRKRNQRQNAGRVGA